MSFPLSIVPALLFQLFDGFRKTWPKIIVCLLVVWVRHLSPFPWTPREKKNRRYVPGSGQRLLKTLQSKGRANERNLWLAGQRTS